MVTTGYMLDQPKPGSPIKTFVNQRFFPAAIDATGAAEVAIETLLEQARKRPLLHVGAAFAFGALISAFVRTLRRSLGTR